MGYSWRRDIREYEEFEILGYKYFVKYYYSLNPTYARINKDGSVTEISRDDYEKVKEFNNSYLKNHG